MSPRKAKNSNGETRKARSRKQPVGEPSKGLPAVDPQFGSGNHDLSNLIARRAYELYASRGFEHGRDVEDWIQAEREILGR